LICGFFLHVSPKLFSLRALGSTFLSFFFLSAGIQSALSASPLFISRLNAGAAPLLHEFFALACFYFVTSF
jgi:hypothetical protein